MKLDRIELQLPEFVRVSWVNDSAREVWEPRFKAITEAWREIEWRSVPAGIRACAVLNIPMSELPQQTLRAARGGCSTLPLASEAQSARGANTMTMCSAVVGSLPDIVAFHEAWEAGDEARVSEMIGQPDCCNEAFRTAWVDDGLNDTTWPMAMKTKAVPQDTASVEISSSPHTNIFWRWVGVRPVPHLPCSFDCAKTIALADRYYQVGRDAGFGQEVDWMLEILSWPIEWSSLHGVAEVRTPILKIATSTDATGSKYVIRRPGTGYPAEGAQGLTFPFRVLSVPKLTGSRGYKRGLDNPLEPAEKA